MGLRDKVGAILGGGGGSGGRLRERAQSILAGGNAPPEVGVTLEGLDAEAEAERRRAGEDPGFSPWQKPGDAGSSKKTSGSDTAGAPQWSGGSSLRDGAYSAAGGVLSGVGINPNDLGSDVAASLQMARERSPTAAGVGKFGGEVAIQAAALPARALGGFATGALGGLLSGVGNSSGPIDERLLNAVPTAAVGAAFGRGGELAAEGAGALSGLLKRKAGELRYEQASQGLIKRGADSASDLADLDALPGGRVAAYQDVKRLGINGRPAEAARQAQTATAAAQAEREALVAQAQQASEAMPGPGSGPLRVDPAALRARIQQANPYPGAKPIDAALNQAADQVAAVAPDFGKVDRLRSYYGKKGNFPSESPEALARQHVHGAINDELDDAMSLAAPGSGTRWRQLGRDQRVSMLMEEAAQTAADKARLPTKGPETLFGAAKRTLYDSYAPGVKEGLYGAAAGAAEVLGSDAAVVSRALPPVAGAVGGALAPMAPMPNVVEGALGALSAGGADLGRYKYDIAQAAASPAPGALGALIQKLAVTDPEFRTQVMPKLAVFTGGR